MKTTQLTQAMNAFEQSGRTVYGRAIDGCHFEINPDGGGCLRVRPSAGFDEELANSPICSVSVEFKSEAELVELCTQMTDDPAAVCKRVEQQLQVEIERIAEEETAK